MKSTTRIAGIFIAALAVAGPAGRQPRAGGETHVVSITARRFEFSPSRITLAKGEPVTLRFVSEDVTHGFFQRSLGLDLEIDPGKPTDVTLTPATAGSYVAICDFFCGTGHGNMKMTILVTG